MINMKLTSFQEWRQNGYDEKNLPKESWEKHWIMSNKFLLKLIRVPLNGVCNHVITKEMKIVSPPLHPFYIYRIGNTNNIMSRKYVCVTRIVVLSRLGCWGNCVGNNFYENHLHWVAVDWVLHTWHLLVSHNM